MKNALPEWILAVPSLSLALRAAMAAKQLPARRLAGRLIGRLVGAVAAGMRRIGMKPSNDRDFPGVAASGRILGFSALSGSIPAAGLLRNAAIRPT